MSHTPETYEAIERWRQGKINIFDEMARLERERDEARDTISDVLRALGAMEHEGPRLAALRVKEERDQARRELDIQLESIKFHMERVPVMQLSLEAQRDFYMGEIEQLRKERDEAREAGWKAAMQAVWDRLPMPEYANDPMTPREVAKLIEFVRSQKEAAK